MKVDIPRKSQARIRLVRRIISRIVFVAAIAGISWYVSGLEPADPPGRPGSGIYRYRETRQYEPGGAGPGQTGSASLGDFFAFARVPVCVLA